MLLKEIGETSYAIKYMAYPSLEIIQHRPMTVRWRLYTVASKVVKTGQ
jgi:hypothetical protein